jgi:hypothetical protein
MSVFTTQPLQHKSWWSRLLGSRSRENATIDLENLLAAGKGGVADISQALRPYRLRGEAVRELLRAAYAKALTQFLADDTLDDTEHEFLRTLRRRLGLSDTEIADIQAATIHPRYERALQEVLVDAHISAEERDALARLEASLRLPEPVRKRLYARVTGPLLQKSYEAALSDRRLSPEEEADLRAMAENLGVEPALSEGSKTVLERFRLLWKIENGGIPEVPVEIRLLGREVCHFKAQTDWRELRRGTRRVSYAGPTVSLPIVKGVRFRMGSFAPAVERSESLTQIDSGTLYITNKRLFFDGEANNRTIRLGRITSYQVFSDAIVIEKDSGRSPYLFISGDLEIAAVILGAVLEHA